MSSRKNRPSGILSNGIFLKFLLMFVLVALIFYAEPMMTGFSVLDGMENISENISDNLSMNISDLQTLINVSGGSMPVVGEISNQTKKYKGGGHDDAPIVITSKSTRKLDSKESKDKVDFDSVVKNSKQEGNDEIVDMDVTPKSGPIKKIELKNLVVSGTTELGIDNVPESKGTSNSVEVYAIDPSSLSFTDATVTVVAKGNELYKCKDWNFANQECLGTWIKLMDITPGQEYSFTLTPEDPGFAEINITRAEHLNSSRGFISDVYNQTKTQDGIWSEPIYHNQYIRATFESNLTNGNVINLYLRNNQSLNTSVNIYENGSSTIIGSTAVIGATGQYDITVGGMSGSNNVFDIKVVNAENNSSAYLEFDYIHDAELAVNASAFIAYRSSTGTCGVNCPKVRAWNPAGQGSWGSEVELPTAGTGVRYAVLKWSPQLNKLVLVVSTASDGFLDAYVCTANCANASNWQVTNDLAKAAAGTPGQQQYDIAFETSTGNAMLVYSVFNSTTTCDLAYQVLLNASTNFSASEEKCIDDNTSALDLQYSWTIADRNPLNNSKEIIAVAHDGTNGRNIAWVWNGSSWNNQITVAATDTTGADQDIAVRYTSDGTKGMVIAGDISNPGNLSGAYWNGNSWARADIGDIAPGKTIRWVTLKADPSSNYLQGVAMDSVNYLRTIFWNGTSWSVTDVDSDSDGSNRAGDFEWENNGSIGKLVWDTDSAGTTLSVINCTPKCNNSIWTISSYVGTGRYLNLYRNPNSTDSVRILGARLDSTSEIGSFSWNGSSFSNYGDASITAATTVNTYDCSSIAFRPIPTTTSAPSVDNSPAVTLISPNNGNVSANNNITFTCNATDDNNLVNITFYWNKNGTWLANGTTTVTGIFNQTSFNRTNLSVGTISWNCRACDSSSQCSFASTNYTATINDGFAPSITQLTSNSSYGLINRVINFSANVADNTMVNTAWFTDNFGVVYGSNVSQTSDPKKYTFGDTTKIGQQFKFLNSTNIYEACVELAFNNRGKKGNVIVSLYSVNAKGTPSLELTNFTILNTSISSTKTVFCGNFSKTIAVNPNVLYALVLKSPASTSPWTYATYYSALNPYSGGSLMRSGGVLWWVKPKRDLYFTIKAGNFSWGNTTYIPVNSKSAIVSVVRTIPSVSDTTHSYRWCANDTSGNINCKELLYYIYPEPIIDNEYPTGSIVSPPNNIQINGNITILGTATDNVDVAYASFQYKNSTSNWTDFVNCDQINSPYQCLWDTSSFSNATEGYDVRILPCDTSGNCNSSIPTRHYTIAFGIPKATYSVIYPNNATSIRNSQTLTIRVNATDNGEGINISKIDLTLLNGTGNATMNFESGNRSANQISVWNISAVINGAATGINYINYYVYDNSTPANNLFYSTIPVRIDNQAPSYDNDTYGASLSDPIYNNSEVSFQVQVSDNYKLSNYIFSNNFSGTWQNFSANFTGTTSDWAGNTSVLYTGNYGYYFILYDEAGNSNRTETRTIKIYSSEPGPTLVTTISPDDLAKILTSNVTFSYNYTGPAADSCNLMINLEINKTTQSPPNSTTLYFQQNFSDGYYDWYVSCNNSFGDSFDSDSRTFTLDTQNPLIYYNPNTQSNSTWSNKNWVFINITASDPNIDTVLLNWNGSNESFQNNVGDIYWSNKTGLADGNYTFYAWTNDTVGNTNQTSIRYVYIDATVPQINFTLPSETSGTILLTRNNILVNISVNDTNLANVTIRLYNSTGLVNSTMTSTSQLFLNFTSLANGVYYFNATACDYALNCNSTETRNVTIDTFAPNATVINPINGTATNISNQNFSVNLSDNLGLANATLNIYNTTGLYNQTTVNIVGNPLEYGLGIFVNLVDGFYTWFWKAYDRAGNYFVTSNKTITIDTIYPGVNIVYPQNITYNVNVSNLNYTLLDINPQTCWYSLDNGVTNTTITCGQNVSGLTSIEGSNTWRVWANDSAGNVNSSTVTFYKDTGKPSWSNLQKNETVIYNGMNVNFNATWTNAQLAGYIFSINQTGNFVNSSYTIFTGTTNVSQNISLITATAGTNVSWFFWANDSVGNANQTDLQSFIVQSRPTSLTFSVNQTMYHQGRSLDHGYDIYIPFQARFVDNSTGLPISGATCDVTNDETNDVTELTYNATTGNYSGQINNYLMYNIVTFNISCSKTNYVNAINSTSTNVWAFMYLSEWENRTYSLFNNYSTTWLRKEPPTGSVYTLSRNISLSAGMSEDQLTLFFYGSGINGSLMKTINLIGTQTLRLNLSLNDTICKPILCIQVEDYYLNTLVHKCGPESTIEANTPTLIEQNITSNTTLDQNDYLSFHLHLNCSSAINEEMSIYYNYTNEPANIEIHNLRPFETQTLIVAETQLDAGYYIGPNQRLNATKLATIRFNNTQSTPEVLEYWYKSEIQTDYPNSIVPNSSYIFNSTGQLLASDNVSAGAPNTAMVHSDNQIMWTTEIIPALTTINETIRHTYRDALRDTENIIENVSAKKVWTVTISDIYVAEGYRAITTNITAWTNYSYYGVPDDWGIQANITNSSGTFDITSQILINTTSKTITFPATDLSVITYTVTATDITPPTVNLISPTPENNTIQNYNWTIINASVTNNVGVDSCVLDWYGFYESMT